MRTNREELLKALESVSAGLAQREVIEQSSCFVFQDGRLTTFNDEVLVSAPSPITGVSGAVPARPLLSLLSKLKEDDLDIDAADGQLRVKGTGRRAGIIMESEIALQPDAIEQPQQWRPLPTDFGEAVDVVQACASADDSSFVLTCIHIAPEFLEACDNFQIARFPIKIGLTESCLVRRDSLVPVVGLGMTEIGSTDAWLHFRNSADLRMSCRRWVEEYQDLSEIMEVDGETATLPAGLSEAVGKAEVFSSDNVEANRVLIALKDGKLKIRGEGASGWYEERKKIAYNGPPLSFMISPSLLGQITKLTSECVVSSSRLKIDAGKFQYVAFLGEVK